MAYKYILSTDYINNLTFDYVETYSFQRGKVYEENSRNLKAEYDRLKVRKEKRNDFSVVVEQRYKELNKLFGFTQYLLNSDGQFHFSSIKTNTFKSEDLKIELLKSILRTDIIEIPYWMCAPIYRDAIVFYDNKGRILSTLNICLGCRYMELEKFVHINADDKTYDLLKEFFVNIGHEVEDDPN